ncbi:MAG: M20/M25/M40 family metallo-hydrolase [Candidatus Hermodarchaeia archaeon]|jgi:aminobenzoyl-glutamate utilization protein B
MADVNNLKMAALHWVDGNQERLSAFHMEIWNYAEPAWREYRSAQAYVDLLRQEGFEVEEGSGDMPTAFMARWGKGKPILGTYAEYDAVPGNSQQVVPFRAPREDLHPWAAGHTDPHSALGVGALAGVLSAKHVMEKHNLPGTLVLFGEPAEKVCGSKPVHAAKGYFDDADAFISYHPYPGNSTVWDTHCGSYWSCVFTFEALETEPWVDAGLIGKRGGSHARPRSPGAIDAVTLMYTTTKYTKENMFSHTGTWTMNEFIMVGGQSTSDNLVPKISQIQYAWRSPTLAIQQQLYKVLENNAKHVAELTNTVAHVRWVTKTRVGLPNHVMADLTYQNLELVGPTKFGEEAKEFAREIQKNMGINPMEEPFTGECQSLIPPQEWEENTRIDLPSWQKNFTSDDYVDYTWHAPTVRLFTGRPMMKEPYGWSNWGSLALGGFPPAIDQTWLVAGKTIGATFIDLLSNPDLLKAAKEEFDERTGGGIGGEKWVAPLLPADFIPPVDLRWPEYVSTVRGEEWWLPNTNGFGEKLD